MRIYRLDLTAVCYVLVEAKQQRVQIPISTLSFHEHIWDREKGINNV